MLVLLEHSVEIGKRRKAHVVCDLKQASLGLKELFRLADADEIYIIYRTCPDDAFEQTAEILLVKIEHTAELSGRQALAAVFVYVFKHGADLIDLLALFLYLIGNDALTAKRGDKHKHMIVYVVAPERLFQRVFLKNRIEAVPYLFKFRRSLFENTGRRIGDTRKTRYVPRYRVAIGGQTELNERSQSMAHLLKGAVRDVLIDKNYIALAEGKLSVERHAAESTAIHAQKLIFIMQMHNAQ